MTFDIYVYRPICGVGGMKHQLNLSVQIFIKRFQFNIIAICKVAGALAKNPLLLGMFDNTVVEEAMQLRSGESSDNEEWEEVNVCDSRTSYILPRAARSIKGSFMFIVNQPAQDKLSQVGCIHGKMPPKG